MNGNIYLTGFMGAGKSTIGRLLSGALTRTFVDMDEALEKRYKTSIADMFSQVGEAIFRERETALLRELARRSRLIVATGGGLPVREINRKLLTESGKTIHLRVELGALLNRLSEKERATRPLWQDRKSLENLFESRRAVYSQCDVEAENNGRPPMTVADAIVEALYPDQKFSVRLGERDCPVIATWRAARRLPELTGERRVAVLMDRTVARLHGERITSGLDDPAILTVAPGERSKTLNSARRVVEGLLEHHFERSDILVAVGGGVISDLGGFVAAIYKRGINFLPVSTSLVGCVDAAVGGKTAVNMPSAKNMIGAFKAPVAVILDTRALSFLKRAHIREGLIEAYKTGLVNEPALADLVENDIKALLARDAPLLGELAVLSAQTKALIVSQDFLDSGLRRILNFGHTFGHAVEAFNEYKISHGQGVSAGMIVATRLSERRGLISSRLSDRIIKTIRAIEPRPTLLPSIEEAWSAMLHDKKMIGGKLIYVLLKGRGEAFCVDDVTREELAAALVHSEAGNG